MGGGGFEEATATKTHPTHVKKPPPPLFLGQIVFPTLHPPPFTVPGELWGTWIPLSTEQGAPHRTGYKLSHSRVTLRFPKVLLTLSVYHFLHVVLREVERLGSS